MKRRDRDENAAINLEHAPPDQVRLAKPALNACGQVGADSQRLKQEADPPKVILVEW